MVSQFKSNSQNSRKIFSLFVIYLLIGSFFVDFGYATGAISEDEVAKFKKSTDMNDKAATIIANPQFVTYLSKGELMEVFAKNNQVAIHFTESQIKSINNQDDAALILVAAPEQVKNLNDDILKQIDWTMNAEPKIHLTSENLLVIMGEDPSKIGDLSECNQEELREALKEKFKLNKETVIGDFSPGVSVTTEGYLVNEGFCSSEDTTKCLRLSLAGGEQYSMISAVVPGSPGINGDDTTYPGFVVCKTKESCNQVEGDVGEISYENGDLVAKVGEDSVIIGEGKITTFKDKFGRLILSDGSSIYIDGVRIHSFASAKELEVTLNKDGFSVNGAASIDSPLHHLSAKLFQASSSIDFSFNGDQTKVKGMKADISYYQNLFKANDGFVEIDLDNDKITGYKLRGGTSIFVDEDGNKYSTIVPNDKEVSFFNDRNKINKVRDLQFQIAILNKNCNDDVSSCADINSKIKKLHEELDSEIKNNNGFFDLSQETASGFQVMKTGQGV